MANEPPRRGEVWWVRSIASTGGEIQKTRPAVIVSNDAANRSLNRVQTVPLTKNVTRFFPGEAKVLLGGNPRKAMADQIGTVSKDRLIERLAVLSKADLAAVEHAMRVQLGLR
jgi:mRNA interferase MazF